VEISAKLTAVQNGSRIFFPAERLILIADRW